jgi:Protein of unknown function (DUF1552)
MKLSRRNILHGAAGLSLALPWLEARAQTVALPRRLVTIFTANGDQIAQRFTTKHETNFVFADMLTPFEAWRSKVLVLDGVNKYHHLLPAGSVSDGHQQGGSALAPWKSGTGSFPLGGTCDANGNNCQLIGYVLGPSIDRAIGDRVLQDNPSMPQRHLNFRVGDNHNDIWNQHCHAGPVGTQAPIPPETNPFTAYTRLFSNIDLSGQQNLARRLAMKQSALDVMKGELTSLQSKVSATDKVRLDQHASALRDIERQLGGMMGAHPACTPLTMPARVDVYRPENHALLGETFFKIIAMSFACDLVRTVNFNWSGNTSNRVYGNIGLTEGHHDISHVSDAAAFAKIRSIKKYLYTESCKLHDALKALPEGGGTVWDRCVVMHWSELSQGDTHQKDKDLVVLAGGADNYFRMGRMLDLTGKPRRSLSNLLVSLWNYMGYADVTTWGEPLLMPDGAGPMPNLV